MRKTAVLLTVAALMILSIPATARPVATDTLRLSWGDNTITVEDGFVTFDVSSVTTVDCAGASMQVLETWTGRTPGILEVKNSLRSGTLVFDVTGVTQETMSGCDVAETLALGETVTVEFTLDGSTSRTRADGTRVLERTGTATLSMFSDTPVDAVLTRVISKG